MQDIILHDQTQQALGQYLARPSHAIVLLGPDGSGKLYLAQSVAAELLAVGRAALGNQAYYRHLTAEKDKASIGIEAVRDLLQFTKLRLPATDARRVITIEGSHTLTTEAQNALLKLLEEPPAGTHFILTASSAQGLLPTIRSRSQQIIVHQPDMAALTAFFQAQGHDAQRVQQSVALSGGLPGLLAALLKSEEHPMKPAVETARKLLQSSQFERLAMVDAMSKQKAETMQVLFVLQHMARAASVRAAAGATSNYPAADKSIRQWHRIMKAAYEAERAYAVSAQSKLALTNLMLSL